MEAYDLVSHGAEVSGNPQECWGYYNTGILQGWGPGYQYPCIHSGSNEYSGGDTVWYNYPIASAGTIISENSTQSNPAKNTNMATESICPKGWSLPTRTHIAGPRADFSPVMGGFYYGGVLRNESTHGRWFGSEAYDGALRYTLFNTSGTMKSSTGRSDGGAYIRCVSEEKTVTDLTYMQDMTPSIANWTPSL